MAEPATTSGNGKHTQITPLAISTDQSAILAAQQTLIASQATMVRDIEGQLGLAPGGTPTPPGTSAVIQAAIDAQGAAIRTQAAYIKHLQDTATALNITLT